MKYIIWGKKPPGDDTFNFIKILSNLILVYLKEIPILLFSLL